MPNKKTKKVSVCDKVRIDEDNYYDIDSKKFYKVTEVDDDDGSFRVIDNAGDNPWIDACDVLEIQGEKKSEKKKKVNFLLKYDLDEDPIEEFETMDEVELRVKELVEEEDSLKKDSIVIYEISKKYAVTVDTKVTKKIVR